MGSQTTKIWRWSEAFRLNRSSTAEAPRKHTGQVGDSSSTARVSCASPLKATLNASKFVGFSDTRGMFPVLEKYQPMPATRRIASNHNACFFRTGDTWKPQPASKLAMTWGKKTITTTDTTEVQNNATLAGLRFLH